MANKPKPILLAMIICDNVIEDKLTNKKTLVGVFNRVNSPKAPCVHPCLNVFLSLTEGRGEYEGRLRCVNVEEDKVILDLGGKINFHDVKEIIEFNFELRGVVFPKFGEYRFEFLCNNEPLGARRFCVLESK